MCIINAVNDLYRKITKKESRPGYGLSTTDFDSPIYSI